MNVYLIMDDRLYCGGQSYLLQNGEKIVLDSTAVFTWVWITVNFSKDPQQKSKAETLISAADVPADLNAD